MCNQQYKSKKSNNAISNDNEKSSSRAGVYNGGKTDVKCYG